MGRARLVLGTTIADHVHQGLTLQRGWRLVEEAVQACDQCVNWWQIIAGEGLNIHVRGSRVTKAASFFGSAQNLSNPLEVPAVFLRGIGKQ